MTRTVLLVDDHPIVRAGLRAVLEADPETRVVGEASTGEEAVSAAAVLHPQVVLCDLRLGAGMDGIATTVALRRLDPAPAVLILTTFDLDGDILRAVEAGAAGYLLKDAPTPAILAGIRDAAAGRTVFDAEVSRRVQDHRSAPASRLTERELEVLLLVARGRSNQQIADDLVISPHTSKTHVNRIMTKVAAHDRAQLVILAYESGLLRPGADD